MSAGGAGGGPSAQDEAAAFAPFRPRRGRFVALGFAALTVVVFTVIAVFLPSPAEGGTWRVGDKVFGGSNPVWVQSMTTTDTFDVDATVAQIKRLEEAGCELVRVTVPKPEDAGALSAIRARIAEILAISLERISVKATTTERLGFTGRREGIAAQAVATLSLPEN